MWFFLKAWVILALKWWLQNGFNNLFQLILLLFQSWLHELLWIYKKRTNFRYNNPKSQSNTPKRFVFFSEYLIRSFFLHVAFFCNGNNCSNSDESIDRPAFFYFYFSIFLFLFRIGKKNTGSKITPDSALNVNATPSPDLAENFTNRCDEERFFSFKI